MVYIIAFLLLAILVVLAPGILGGLGKWIAQCIGLGVLFWMASYLPKSTGWVVIGCLAAASTALIAFVYGSDIQARAKRRRQFNEASAAYVDEHLERQRRRSS